MKNPYRFTVKEKEGSIEFFVPGEHYKYTILDAIFWSTFFSVPLFLFIIFGTLAIEKGQAVGYVLLSLGVILITWLWISRFKRANNIKASRRTPSVFFISNTELIKDDNRYNISFIEKLSVINKENIGKIKDVSDRSYCLTMTYGAHDIDLAANLLENTANSLLYMLKNIIESKDIKEVYPIDPALSQLDPRP